MLKYKELDTDEAQLSVRVTMKEQLPPGYERNFMIPARRLLELWHPNRTTSFRLQGTSRKSAKQNFEIQLDEKSSNSNKYLSDNCMQNTQNWNEVSTKWILTIERMRRYSSRFLGNKGCV